MNLPSRSAGARQPELFGGPQRPSPPQRLFFALLPAADEQAAIAAAAQALRQRVPLRSAIRPGNLHATVLFLGDHAGAEADAVCELAVRAGQAVRAPAFALALDQVASFGGRQDAALVLAASTVPEALRSLRDQLMAPLRRLRLPGAAAALHPHVTVAYTGAARLPRAEAPPVTLRVREFHLLQRVRGEGGYRRAGSWPLQAE